VQLIHFYRRYHTLDVQKELLFTHPVKVGREVIVVIVADEEACLVIELNYNQAGLWRGVTTAFTWV